MTDVDNKKADRTTARVVRELHELIAALDRRVPQVQRAGEVAIARAAAALRAEALKRIGALELERRRIGAVERPAMGAGDSVAVD